MNSLFPEVRDQVVSFLDGVEEEKNLIRAWSESASPDRLRPASDFACGSQDLPGNASATCSFLLEHQEVPQTRVPSGDGSHIFFDEDGHSQVLFTYFLHTFTTDASLQVLTFSRKDNKALLLRIQRGKALVMKGNYNRPEPGPSDGVFQNSFDDGNGGYNAYVQIFIPCKEGRESIEHSLAPRDPVENKRLVFFNRVEKQIPSLFYYK